MLAAEARASGFQGAKPVAGGVTLRGGWADVWRANLELRGATRVLVRVASFRVLHLAQLDKRARRVDWAALLPRGSRFRVEATCRKSRIYHSGAAAQRIETAVRETIAGTATDEADVTIMARIDNDVCTISVDTSGAPLHKRGYKEAVNKAPMRETMAALFLRQCGFSGSEPVLDPMCGSGTFVIEAAEIAAGLKPGRSRGFAFEQLATFDAAAWQALRSGGSQVEPESRFYGSDRDAGAIRMSRENAERAGVAAWTTFEELPVSALQNPNAKNPGIVPGLVIINPPYGDRIGDKSRLSGLYRTLGTVLLERFPGWRVGLITTEVSLAKATRLPFLPPGPPVAHGGLRIKLFQSKPLP